MKIALKYHDNDMYHTFMAVFEALAKLYEYEIGFEGYRFNHRWECFLENKTKLKRVVNELSYPMYELYQNQYRKPYRDSETMESEAIKMKKWLQINQGDLFIGLEIDEYLITDESKGDSVFIMLDTNTHDRKYWITSICR